MQAKGGWWPFKTNTGRGTEVGAGDEGEWTQWDRSDDWAVRIVLLLILAIVGGR